MDDKKVIFDTKALREIEKKKNKKNFKNFESPLNKKKKGKKKVKPSFKPNILLQTSDENLSKQKAEIFQQLAELDNRVTNLRNLTKNSAKDESFKYKTKAATKIQAWVRGFIVRKAVKDYLDHQSNNGSSDLKSSNIDYSKYEEEDEEVQQIMGGGKEKIDSSEFYHKNKSYEKILASQMKMKIKQQQQLTELRAKDLLEMNKLAEVLGDNQEMKEKFKKMINRRYSKLGHLFEENIENIKQVLGCDQITETNLLGVLSEKVVKDSEKSLVIRNSPLEEVVLPSVRNTISEFSSSFLEQLKGVPVPVDITFDNANRGELDYIDSPEESVYSRDTVSEPMSDSVLFPSIHKVPPPQTSQDEPNLPLISDSYSDNPALLLRERSEEGALMSLVQEIKEDSKNEDLTEEEFDNTLNLNEEKVQKNQNNPIFICEESFSSNEIENLAEYSSILGTPEAENSSFPKAETSKSKIEGRNIVETFPYAKVPSGFTASMETSAEHDGFELIINRVIFTLENYVFFDVFQEIMKNFEEFVMPKTEKKQKIPIKGLSSYLPRESQVQTDQGSIVLLAQKLFSIKDLYYINQKLEKVYNPLTFLSRIQENFDELEEDLQIFDYHDLEKADNSMNSSVSYDLSQLNPYTMTHNKMIVDVLNEAILRNAKSNFFPLSNDHLLINSENLPKLALEKLTK